MTGDVASLTGAMLQWLSEHAAEGLFTTDVDLRIRWWNEWLHNATGIRAASAVGCHVLELIPSLKERGFDAYYRDALSGEVKVLSHKLHRYIVPSIRSAAGEQMPQSGRIAPLMQDGAVVGTITVIADVSERVAAERQLRAQIATAEEARNVAEEASRVKDVFLATLSHEIRTPLNAVLGWTRILRSREHDAATLARAIEVIDRNASAQLTLITDMLDMARITAGKIRLEVADVDLPTTIRASIDAVRPAADAKGIAIVLDASTSLPMLRGDADRLLQVFWNLLSNAVKFTDGGGHISIRVAPSPGSVRVSITDTGMGIAPEFLPHLFQRFKQADPSAARRHGGLGLGLALVRELVHLHGGSVDVDSAGLRAGTTVTVVLPVPATSTAARIASRPAPEKSLLNGIHILIVEDDPDAREIVSTTVADAGASVTAVGSVAEALGALRDRRAERPQVVVADIGLPGADGYSLISEIRRMPLDEGGQLPVIAVTAYATAEDRRVALSAGFFAHIAKPFAPESLVSTIARAVEPVA